MEHPFPPKKQFSLLGLAGFAILGIGTLAQILLISILTVAYPQWMEASWGMWLVTFAPIYLIAVPIGLLILRKAPANPPPQRRLKCKTFLVTLLISVCMTYIGNLLGNIIMLLLQSLLGVSPGNPILDYSMSSSILPKILFLVILAPIIEEYVFRKQMIDRMAIYGEKTAVIVSALIFGLFHGNLAQLFYAFTGGLVFGYVYLKTGRLRYSTLLHMFLNFIGSVAGPLLLEKSTIMDPAEVAAMTELTPELLWAAALGLYAIVLIGLAVVGFVLLCRNFRKTSFAPAELELPKEGRFKTVYLNTGMILFMLFCIIMIAVSAILS